MNNRIYWVDYVKGIAIILVVYAHVTFGLNRAGIMDDSLFKAPFMMIAVNTMPWFFFLSGLFFYDSLIKRGPLRLIANRLDTIIYPYIIWSIIQGLIEIAFSRWTNNQFESLSAVLSLLWQPRAQLWFLYVLFFINVIVLLIGMLFKGRFVIFSLSLFAYWGCVNIHIDYPVIKQILGYLCFFVLALCVKDYLPRIYEYRRVLVIPVIILTVIGHWVLYSHFESAQQLHGLWQFLIALLSLAFIVLLTMNISIRLPLLLLIGKSSMVIYLVHIIAGSGMRIILHKGLGIDNLYVHLALGMTAGVFMPLLVYRGVKYLGLSLLFEIPEGLSTEATIRRMKATHTKELPKKP